MGERVLGVWLLLLLVGVAAATEVNVTFVDDIGTFTGGVMRIESVGGDVGDKIYAYQNLANVGILKFNFETALEEVYLNFVLIKNGMVAGELHEGPFEVSGEEISVDVRTGVEVIEVSAPDSEELDVSVVVVDNESGEEEVVEKLEVQGEVVEAEVSRGNSEMAMIEMGYSNWYFVAGGILAIAVLFILGLRNRGFRDFIIRLNYFSDAGELARLEAKIRKKDELIAKMRRDCDVKERIASAKKRLNEEDQRLEGMIRKKVHKKD